MAQSAWWMAPRPRRHVPLANVRCMRGRLTDSSRSRLRAPTAMAGPPLPIASGLSRARRRTIAHSGHPGRSNVEMGSARTQTPRNIRRCSSTGVWRRYCAWLRCRGRTQSIGLLRLRDRFTRRRPASALPRMVRPARCPCQPNAGSRSDGFHRVALLSRRPNGRGGDQKGPERNRTVRTVTSG